MRRLHITSYVILVGLAFSLVATAVVLSTHWILKAGVDTMMTDSFGDRLNAIVEQFAVQNEKLEATGMPGLRAAVQGECRRPVPSKVLPPGE